MNPAEVAAMKVVLERVVKVLESHKGRIEDLEAVVDALVRSAR